MTLLTHRMRSGTVHGVNHARLNMNNQDALQTMEFSVLKWDKTFRIGIVSDGCSGIPAFTRSEVGAQLLAVYCLARIQEMIVRGTTIAEIPIPLYHAVTNFLRELANMVMPATVHWPYPIEFTGAHAFRNKLKAHDRFTIDYLKATIIGFIDDGETLVTFQAGDGVIIVDDVVMAVDQNDIPDYPAPGGSFQTHVYDSQRIKRVALATDGIEKMLKVPGVNLSSALFEHLADRPIGLQYLLNILRKQHPDKIDDDLTVVTWERLVKA